VGEDHGRFGEARLGRSDVDGAAESVTHALEMARRVEYRPAIGPALSRLGDVDMARGDATGAAGRYEEALAYDSGAPKTARTLERLAAARTASRRP
jgi:predicted TPR repeat methyltransferase